MGKSEWVLCKCLEIVQPIGTFYIAVMDARDVIDISFADIRRMEERDIEKIVGIQRPLSDSRVTELKAYVKNVDAAFPTGILLSLSSEDVTFHSGGSSIKIRRAEKVAKIIDGQHRIAGLSDIEAGKFYLNVTIFIDMDIEDQAMMFATINLKQTKVSKSLAYDLFDYARTRSPQKTCHNIARVMHTKDGSPFAGKIKILGVATEDKTETITQATFVERLMVYVSTNPMQDRDQLRRGLTLTKITEKAEKRLIFRNLFIAERDAAIAKIVWNYFTAVSERWPSAWNGNERGIILNRTTGFGALMRYLRPAYLKCGGHGGHIVEVKEFLKLFNLVDLKDSDFSSVAFVPGSSGEGELHNHLLSATGLTANAAIEDDEL